MSPRVRLLALAVAVGGAFALGASFLLHSPHELRAFGAEQGLLAPLALVPAALALARRLRTQPR